MAEYIEREALKQKIAEVQDESGDPISGSQYEIGYHNGLTMAYTLAITAPAADVAPVVHGRWQDYHFVKTDCPRDGFPTVKCSNCEIAFCDLINNHQFMYHYCPNCGARMDGE